MFSFNFGKKIFLGVDVGASAVKVAELELRDEHPYLTNYGWAPIFKKNNSALESNQDFLNIEILPLLKKIVKAAKFKGKDVFISIPAFGGLITLIKFPKMPAADMEQAIRFEAHKYIPASLEDVVLSWDIVGESSGDSQAGGSNVEVLLVAARRSEIEIYEKLVKDAGLNVSGIEIENISMVDSLIGNDPGSFIILDIGAKICNIIYVEKGIIKVNRNMDVGGNDITAEIAKNLGITQERAEKMKLSGRNFFSVESGLKFPTLSLVMGEIARVMEMSSKDKGVFKLDALILSGGTANLPGLKEFLTDKLKVKVILGNPLSRIGYDQKLEPVLAGIRTEFSVSLGLALRGINEYLAQKDSKKAKKLFNK